MSDLDDERWLPSDMKAERKLKKVLAKYLSEEAAADILEALKDVIDAAKDDLRDQINQRGQYDPDY